MKLPWLRPVRDVPAYVDTPSGLFSAGGIRFRTTEPLLREYAGPVLDAVGLPSLIRATEVWLRTPEAVAAFGLLGLLAVGPWGPAAVLAVGLYGLAAVAAPGIATPALTRVLRVAGHPVAQGLAYVLVLSAFAASGRIAAMWTGVGGFVAIRLGLLDVVLRPALTPAFGALYPLPPADQTLRSLIVRTAIRRGISLPALDALERRARSFWKRGGTNEE